MNVLLIYSILLCFLWEYLSVLIKPIIVVLSKNKSLHMNLRKKISDLNAELSKISMTDEFAKYARVQRKRNKLKAELDSDVSEQLQASIRVKLLVTTVAKVLMGLLSIVFVWMYKYEPVIVFPEVWLSPVSPFISFPTATNGAVGLPFWFSVCSAFIKSAGTLIMPSISK